MKVIGTVNHDRYLCEITHAEIEKVMDKYFGKLKRLSVGDELDLGDGYNFRSDIERLCKDMTESIESFERARNTLMRFAVMFSEKSTEERSE